MIGKSILHYSITERLGGGGMGELYRAYDTRLARSVALKFLPASFQYDPDRRSQFLKEARAASSLRSPAVAAIFDIGEFEGASFIVMEFVEGEELSARINRGPIRVREALDIAAQIADALDEAHTAGIVHRDIKSSNIMITERQLVKIIDFGLAKISANVSGSVAAGDDPTAMLKGNETKIGVVSGTVSYMSPEQALGRNVDHRSDLFSTGVVIYEMLTARLPFVGNSPTEIIDQIVHQQPAAIARFNYQTPLELEQIVRKCLEKDAGFRYQSARELYIDLHNLRRQLDSHPLPSAHELSEQLQTAALPAPDAFPAAATVSGLAVSAPASAPLQKSIAVATFANITREPADNWIGSGIAETVTADLKNIKGISVIGRERIFEALKGRTSGDLMDPDGKLGIEIGRNLGATWIISGGYQRVSQMIRITARLLEIATGTIVTTVKIDGNISDIFDLQDRIVFELSQKLNIEVGYSERAAIGHRETLSIEAYEDFSQGMLSLRTATRDSIERAVLHFENAITRDPGYASAWAGLGATYNLKAGFLHLRDFAAKAIEVEKRALELNPRLAEAHQWLGSAYLFMDRVDEAIESIKKAIELEPGNAGPHAALARAYWVGKGMVAEGIIELESAAKRNPEAGYVYLQLCFLYNILGDYDRAEAAALKAVDLQERKISGAEGLQVVGAHTRLGHVYYLKGRYDDAISEYKREMELLSDSDHALRNRAMIELNQKMGAGYLRKGDDETAERCFQEAIRMFSDLLAKGAGDPFTKYYIASVYALKEQPDEALKYLQESFSELRAINTIRARVDPDFEKVRTDPRFLDVVG
ncbi:MAG TPA: protein kinase [Blastocatellia bacterium]|nr:protein kinase [Blastocatellia bacterium]